MSQDEQIMDLASYEDPDPETGTRPAPEMVVRGKAPQDIVPEYPAISGLFDLGKIEAVLAELGWDAGAHVEALLEIVKLGAKPADRLRALSDLQAFIEKQVEKHSGTARVRREVVTKDADGRQRTDSVEFTQRWAGAIPASEGIDTGFESRGDHGELPDLE